jgi:hypothetical protein
MRTLGTAVAWSLAAMMTWQAWALTPAQESDLATAATNIKAAAGDLAAAQSSAGTADRPATGSRLRLTQTRLDQANQRLEFASQKLAALPADDAAVKPVQQSYDAAKKSADAIRDIITPKPAGDAPAEGAAPAAGDKPASEPAKPAAAPRLPYQQEEALKNARFHLNDAVGYAQRAQGVSAKLLDAQQAGTVIHADVVRAQQDIATARQKLENAGNQLQGLPAEHPAVAPVARQRADLLASLDPISATLARAGDSLGKQADVQNYPQYKDDLDKLGDFTSAYREFQSMVQRSPELAELIQKDAAVLAEVKRIAQVYAPLAQQKTPAGERMEKATLYFLERREAFSKELQAYGKELPALIDADLAGALKLAQQAVSEGKPAFFGPDGGINQQLEYARQKLLVLSALSPAQAQASQGKIEQTRQQVRTMGESLREQIIANNPVPPDRYAGADRQKLIDLATATWAAIQPDAKVLKACIPSEQWTRKTQWVVSSDRFTKEDASTVQVQLLVADRNGLAVIRPVTVKMDHQQGDALRAWAMDGVDDALPPHRYVQVQKLR